MSYSELDFSFCKCGQSEILARITHFEREETAQFILVTTRLPNSENGCDHLHTLNMSFWEKLPHQLAQFKRNSERHVKVFKRDGNGQQWFLVDQK